MPPDAPIALEALLAAAVHEIIRDEDPQRLGEWLQRELPHFMEPDAPDALPPEGMRAFATTLARAIWNATPLPGNRFRPEPLPAPGRNAPCPCGSGQKFKRCCARAPEFHGITPEMMWGYVFDALSDTQREQAFALKQVPVAAIAGYASDLTRDDDAERAVELLEPIFQAPLTTLRTAAHEFALDVFMDALDEVDGGERKLALIERIVREAARSPLRAGAWQRLATIRMDRGDPGGAWEAFRAAQRDQPDAPALAQLEVLLLVSDGRENEIPDRARYWARRLRKKGFDDGDELIIWLKEVGDNPRQALASLAIHASGGEGERLRAWLDVVRDRPIARYTVSDGDTGPAADDDGGEELAAQLRQMGVPASEIERMMASLQQAVDETPPEDEETRPDRVTEPAGQILVAPDQLLDVAQQWHQVFLAGKPFGVHDMPLDEKPMWDSEEQWSSFLEAHPEAYDSLDVLDDLATAVMDHPMCGDPGFDSGMLLPLLDRAAALVEAALEDAPEATLPWIDAANRPALRPLSRLVMWHLQADSPERSASIAERLIALNPNDNHAVRGILMERYLRNDRDEDALSLAESYPDDGLAEITYGKVLALYRLQRMEPARAALDEAMTHLPKVRDYLVRKRVRAPKLGDGIGVTFGGDDQAWYYRQDMRDEWERTRGALAWLDEAAPRKRRR